MEWFEFLVIILLNMSIFMWSRSESRADIRHMDAKLDANRQLINAMRDQTNTEIKDLHWRLVAMEKHHVVKENKKETGKK